MKPSAHRILFGTIFFTGAAVLIFEIAAVRALSPYFGSSIYVVSSVLTVILAALSLGYYFGGRLADKRPHIGVLYSLVGLSGLLMNVLFYFSQHLFPIAGEFLPITVGPLILATLFFLAPAFLLGIDSPFVIKLLTTSGNEAENGAIVGSTFFWSTVGSIVGSLLSGFVLIPYLGLQLTFVVTATLLSVLALAALYSIQPHTTEIVQKKQQHFVIATALLSVVMAIVILQSTYQSNNPGALLYETDGYYSHIEVRERPVGDGSFVRTLHRGTNTASGIQTGTTDFLYQYLEYARTHQYLQDKTDNFLVIGGGAYTVPRALLAEEPDLHIDVVEIEPSLYQIAQEYFELEPTDRLTNYTQDARTFLNTTDNQYDAIFVDAFHSGHFFPPQLTTQEFFQKLRDHMTDQGVIVFNVIGVTGVPEKTLTGSIVKTIQSVFPGTQIYAAQPWEDQLHNLMVVARKDGVLADLPAEFVVDMKDGTRVPVTERWRPLDLLFLDKQVVFTDDLAPIEPLLAKQLFEYY